MAYLDHDFALGGSRIAHLEVVPKPAPRFSDLEWSVIALSRRDPVRSTRPAHFGRRLLMRMFGLGAPSPLADPRLETLRRTAINARSRGFGLPEGDITRFIDAGFSEAQLNALVCLVYRGKQHAGSAA